MPPPDSRRRKGTTPDRHFRADDGLYLPALAKTKREGRSLSWVLRVALRLYLRDELPLDAGDEPG